MTNNKLQEEKAIELFRQQCFYKSVKELAGIMKMSQQQVRKLKKEHNIS